jgi:hypothetical protein
MTDGPTAAKREHRWTWDLLSSSLPLEFAIAKRMTKYGYRLSADYAYERAVSGTIKEFSIDLLATRQIAKAQPDLGFSSNIADVSILVECKYRRPSKAILLLPTVLDAARNAGRETVRGMIAISTGMNVDLQRDLVLPICYKAVEIDFEAKTKEKVITHEELRHGLEQLQYALLTRVVEHVSLTAAMMAFGVGSVPMFLLPILVTNAPLYVAKENFDQIDLTRVADIREIGTSVDAVALDLAIGPQLKGELGRLISLDFDAVLKQFKLLDVRKRAADPGFNGSAAMEFQFLISRTEMAMLRYFSRFVICTEDRFETILSAADELMAEKLLRATELPASE